MRVKSLKNERFALRGSLPNEKTPRNWFTEILDRDYYLVAAGGEMKPAEQKVINS